MKTYRAVLFDLFDTVVDFHVDRLPQIRLGEQTLFSTSGAVYEVLREYAPQLEFETFYEAFRESWRQVEERRKAELREYPSQVRFRRLLELLHLEALSEDVVERLVRAHMETWSRGAELPEANRQLLVRASERFPLGLVSNFDHPPTAHRILRDFGIHDVFTVIVISAEVSWRKPHREIFLHALARLDVSPRDALFVGDTFEADVLGAKSIGMDVAWLNRRGDEVPEDVVDPDYVIARLEDLGPVLGL
ncbi:MAG: HAD family hydrolase [Blastocatellia bacterium]|nr:HAD family hydrolase [Blastocatellia bacterium]MCS7156984.1 HAD family hydrolase [Blastocatellia bacterium]MCX7752185.1 HAD family hydrolase [Blastocatellia bacterium]MDW8167677.1 HAD family hydrolase [Acidobacteriota bacterium]MDW8256276.1 HAD family hydrolase [Acidobacteriota bacterium]